VQDLTTAKGDAVGEPVYYAVADGAFFGLVRHTRFRVMRGQGVRLSSDVPRGLLASFVEGCCPRDLTHPWTSAAAPTMRERDSPSERWRQNAHTSPSGVLSFGE